MVKQWTAWNEQMVPRQMVDTRTMKIVFMFAESPKLDHFPHNISGYIEIFSWGCKAESNAFENEIQG